MCKTERVRNHSPCMTRTISALKLPWTNAVLPPNGVPWSTRSVIDPRHLRAPIRNSPLSWTISQVSDRLIFSPHYEDDFQPWNNRYFTGAWRVGSWTGSWVPFLIGSHGSGSNMIYYSILMFRPRANTRALMRGFCRFFQPQTMGSEIPFKSGIERVVVTVKLSNNSTQPDRHRTKCILYVPVKQLN